MVLGELMVEPLVPTHAVYIFRLVYLEILRGTRPGRDSRVIRLGKRILREKVLYSGVEHAGWNLITREGIPDPLTGCVLAGRERIVDRQAQPAKREVPLVHLRRGHGHLLDRRAAALEKTTHGGQKEGPVPAVVQLRDPDRAGEGAIKPVIEKWVRIPVWL